ncbi:MAG: hypothetical protein ACI9OO_000124 [Bacteroidia bacterium]|jgi:hypothetical protein
MQMLRTDASLTLDHIEPGTPSTKSYSTASRPHHVNADLSSHLREAYIKGFWGQWDTTLGKQQIVWDKADGIKIMDIVNPQTFLEFIVEDFDRSIIPLRAIRSHQLAYGS